MYKIEGLDFVDLDYSIPENLIEIPSEPLIDTSYLKLNQKISVSDLETDIHGLYGGDHWAQKAAAHEFKSLNALIQCSVSRLHLPLTEDFVGL